MYLTLQYKVKKRPVTYIPCDTDAAHTICHTHTLSLSLSLSQTHSHTHTSQVQEQGILEEEFEGEGFEAERASSQSNRTDPPASVGSVLEHNTFERLVAHVRSTTEIIRWV